MPRHNSSLRLGQRSSATGSVRRTIRRPRKPNGVVRPSLPELGLYRTVAELANVTPFPEYVIRKWIRERYIKPVLYRGRWYFSKIQFYRWYRSCLEIFPFFMDSLTADFGYPVIFEDGEYRRL